MKLIYSILLLLVVACKDSKAQNNLLNSKEWSLYSSTLIKELKDIRNSENLEPNGGHNYKKDDSSIHIELLEDMKTHKKIVDYTTINDIRNTEGTRFFLSDENKILLITTEKNSGNNQILRDTILF